MSEIEIRNGTEADIDPVVSVFRAARAQMPYVPPLHTAAEDTAYFRSHLEKGASLMVADGSAGVLGFALCRPGWLEHLYVHPAAQRQGVGRHLLDRVKADQPDGFQLWVFQPNADARRFYERHGFVCMEQTDGSSTEEKVPDARYQWVPA